MDSSSNIQFAWRKHVPTLRSRKVHPELELGTFDLQHLDTRNATNTGRGVNPKESLLSLNNPLLICSKCSSDSENQRWDTEQPLPVVIANGEIREEQAVPSSSAAAGVMMSGVMLGAPVFAPQYAEADSMISISISESNAQECSGNSWDDSGGVASNKSTHISVDLGHTTDDGNGQPLPTFHPSKYIELYYDLMYSVGVSVYRFSNNSSTGMDKAQWVKARLYQGFFVGLVALSALQSLTQSKLSFLLFMSHNGDNRYYYFVQMTSNFASLLAKLRSTFMMSFNKEKATKMFQVMHAYEEVFYIPGNEQSEHSRSTWKRCNWRKTVMVMLAISTVTLAILRATIGIGANGLTDLVLVSSQELSQDIFVWRTNNITATFSQIKAEYGTNVTTTTISMACIVIVRDIATYLQIGMMFDLIVVVGFVMRIYVQDLLKEVKHVTENVEMGSISEWTRLQSQREAVWKKYQKLKDVNDAVNDVFDPLLKLLHLNNLMSYAFFMILFIFWDNSGMQLTLYAVNLVKAEVGYFLAGKVAEHNGNVRTWIRRWAYHTGKFKFEDKEVDAYIVLDELDKEPIGLGKGKFLIHQTFHYKFLGLVLSVFFSKADEEK